MKKTKLTHNDICQILGHIEEQFTHTRQSLDSARDVIALIDKLRLIQIDLAKKENIKDDDIPF